MGVVDAAGNVYGLPPMTVDAILPAAGRICGAFAAEAGVGGKALVPVGGHPVLEHTLRVLRASGRIGRIVVVGPDEIARHPAARLADAVLPETGGSGPDNIYLGLNWLCDKHRTANPERVLVLTTDLPFLTPQGLAAFLDACSAHADVSVPLLTQQEFESAYPGCPAQYVHLRDGNWTLGGAYLIRPSAVAAGRLAIERVFRARKSQIGMAKLLGVVFALRFLIHKLTTDDVRMRCETLVGCSARIVLGCSPELAFDIDEIEDYHYAARSRTDIA